MSVCLSSARVCVLRVSRLAANCDCAQGEGDGIITSAIVSLQATPEYSTGDDLELKNGCGDICATVKTGDKLKRMNLTLQLCTRNPETIELMTGAWLYEGTGDNAGEFTGAARRGIGLSDPDPVSVEIWTQAVSNTGSCNTSGANWWRWLYPWSKWTLGDVTHEAGISTVSMTGFAEANPTRINTCWNDWPSLTPLDPNSPEHFILDPNGPPTTSCGYVLVPQS